MVRAEADARCSNSRWTIAERAGSHGGGCDGVAGRGAPMGAALKLGIAGAGTRLPAGVPGIDGGRVATACPPMAGTWAACSANTGAGSGCTEAPCVDAVGMRADGAGDA